MLLKDYKQFNKKTVSRMKVQKKAMRRLESLVEVPLWEGVYRRDPFPRFEESLSLNPFTQNQRTRDSPVCSL